MSGYGHSENRHQDFNFWEERFTLNHFSKEASFTILINFIFWCKRWLVHSWQSLAQLSIGTCMKIQARVKVYITTQLPRMEANWCQNWERFPPIGLSSSTEKQDQWLKHRHKVNLKSWKRVKDILSCPSLLKNIGLLFYLVHGIVLEATKWHLCSFDSPLQVLKIIRPASCINVLLFTLP